MALPLLLWLMYSVARKGYIFTIFHVITTLFETRIVFKMRVCRFKSSSSPIKMFVTWKQCFSTQMNYIREKKMHWDQLSCSCTVYLWINVRNKKRMLFLHAPSRRVSIDPCMPNLGTEWKCVWNLRFWPFYPQESSYRFLWNRKAIEPRTSLDILERTEVSKMESVMFPSNTTKFHSSMTT